MVTRRSLAAFGALLLAIGFSAATADAVRSKRTCRKLCTMDISTCAKTLMACGALPASDTLARSLEVPCEREIVRRCKAVKTHDQHCFSPSGAFLDPELD